MPPVAESRSGTNELTASPNTASPNTASPNTASRSTRSLPSGASVLRRGLFIWGLGHISIGDRRGWLLMALQPIVIVGLLMVAVQLIDGTRWIIVFPPLAAILAFWLGTGDPCLPTRS